MVCSGVEGSTGSTGRMKVRRLERMAPLSGSWADGRGEVGLGACEAEADWISSQRTGEALVT